MTHELEGNLPRSQNSGMKTDGRKVNVLKKFLLISRETLSFIM